MAQSFTLPSKKAGLPPGTLVHVGSLPAQRGRITLTTYTNDHCQEMQVNSLTEILNKRKEGHRLWVQFEGLDIVEMVEAIGRELQVHPLVLEDILNTRITSYNVCYTKLLRILCRKVLCNLYASH